MALVVYCLTNKLNGKKYVGQTKDLKERIRQHRNGLNSSCRAIRAAVRKHGWDSFDVEILSHPADRSEANRIERKFIRDMGTLSPRGYNLRDGGHTRSAFSEESRARISEAAKRRGVSDACHRAQRLAVTGRPTGRNGLEKIRRDPKIERRRKENAAAAVRDSDFRMQQSARMRRWWADRKTALGGVSSRL